MAQFSTPPEPPRPPESPESPIPPETTLPPHAGGAETNPDARMWAMIAHLAALAGFIVPVVGNIVGPLVVWLIKKDQYPFVDDQGKEALNFQITVTIGLAIGMATAWLCVGVIIMVAVAVAALIMAILAGIKANEGVAYRYPFALRLIK